MTSYKLSNGWELISLSDLLSFCQERSVSREMTSEECVRLMGEIEEDNRETRCLGAELSDGSVIVIRAAYEHDYSELTPGSGLTPPLCCVRRGGR